MELYLDSGQTLLESLEDIMSHNHMLLKAPMRRLDTGLKGLREIGSTALRSLKMEMTSNGILMAVNTCGPCPGRLKELGSRYGSWIVRYVCLQKIIVDISQGGSPRSCTSEGRLRGMNSIASIGCCSRLLSEEYELTSSFTKRYV